MSVIVFDMDETLYDERAFVRGGFHAVSAFMGREWRIPVGQAYRRMLSEMEAHGRGTVFDAVLRYYGAHSKMNVKRCLSVYRSHKPRITLYPDAHRALARFKDQPLYVLTDGNVRVQRRKARALGLYERVAAVTSTWQYGPGKAKPSPFCLLKICERENVPPPEVLYVGDDPNKDFVGIKPLGFRTVRVLRGRFADIRLDAAHEADRTVRSLDDL